MSNHFFRQGMAAVPVLASPPKSNFGRNLPRSHHLAKQRVLAMNSVPTLYRSHGIANRSRARWRWPKRVYVSLATIISAIKSELRARRAAAQLASMDDRMLRDIGISRDEIGAVVRRRPLGRAKHVEPRWSWAPNPFRID